MKKRTLAFYVLAIGIAFSGCKTNSDVSQEIIDVESRNIQFLDSLVPQLYGNWTMKTVDIQFIEHLKQRQNEAGIEADTTLEHFAVLNINAVDNKFPKNPVCSGTLTFRQKEYPITFQLISFADNAPVDPKVFFLLETNFPAGTRIPTEDDWFLKNIGFFDNYSLVLSSQKSMTWSGLNEGVKRIELVKN